MKNFGERIKAVLGAAAALVSAETADAQITSSRSTEDSIIRIEPQGTASTGHPHQRFAQPSIQAVEDALPKALGYKEEAVGQELMRTTFIPLENDASQPYIPVSEDGATRAEVGAPVSFRKAEGIQIGVGDGIEFTRGNTTLSLSGDSDEVQAEVKYKF